MGQTTFSDSNAVRVTTIGDVGVGPARICSVHVLVAGGNGRLTITDGIGGPIALDVDFSATSTHFFDIPDKGIRCEDSMVVTSVANITAVTIGYTGGTRGFVPPTIRNFIDLDPIANAYYEMAAPITFAGDFEVEVEFSTTSETGCLISGTFATNNSFNIIIRNGLMRAFIYVGSTVSDNLLPTDYISDGKLNTVKVTYNGTTASIFVNGVLADSTTWSANGAQDVKFFGSRAGSYDYFDGIIANAKFTDKSGASDVVTTFKLNNSPAAENYTYGNERYGMGKAQHLMVRKLE